MPASEPKGELFTRYSQPVRDPQFACQRSMKTGGPTHKKFLQILLKKMSAEKKFLLAKKNEKLIRVIFALKRILRDPLQNFFQHFLFRNVVEAVHVAEAAYPIEARLAVKATRDCNEIAASRRIGAPWA